MSFGCLPYSVSILYAVGKVEIKHSVYSQGVYTQVKEIKEFGYILNCRGTDGLRSGWRLSKGKSWIFLCLRIEEEETYQYLNQKPKRAMP